METIRQRLERDLHTAINRLRYLGGSVAGEELPGPIGINVPFADEVDAIQASERREIGCATRELLMRRVNRLSAALDRLDNGEYGTCVECNEAISPARLHAVPEVQTCVRSRTGSSASAAGSRGRRWRSSSRTANESGAPRGVGTKAVLGIRALEEGT